MESANRFRWGEGSEIHARPLGHGWKIHDVALGGFHLTFEAELLRVLLDVFGLIRGFENNEILHGGLSFRRSKTFLM